MRSAEEEIFVDYYDSLIAQIKHDGAALAASIARGDYASVGEARAAMMRTMIASSVELRSEFLGRRAKEKNFDLLMTTSIARAVARAQPELEKREAARLGEAVGPEMNAVFASLRARFPEPDAAGPTDASPRDVARRGG